MKEEEEEKEGKEERKRERGTKKGEERGRERKSRRKEEEEGEEREGGGKGKGGVQEEGEEMVEKGLFCLLLLGGRCLTFNKEKGRRCEKEWSVRFSLSFWDPFFQWVLSISNLSFGQTLG